MKALRQLGFLKLSLRPDASTPDEDHRVLELFRNRAELKKAYGGLQDETFRLKDLIKQQEGATQRVQEMLNTLEGRLGPTETAYAALVFYQLRRLWQSGRELITQFVAGSRAPAGGARAPCPPCAAQPPPVRPPPGGRAAARSRAGRARRRLAAQLAPRWRRSAPR